MRMIVKLMVAATAVTMTAPALAADNPRVTAEVMAIARAQWAAEMADRSVAEQMATIADDYTEFNPDHPTRLDGKALNSRLYQAWSDGPKSIAGDMMNAKVQTYGDTAILTYNYVGLSRAKDGKITPNNAKSTRVYARQNGRWMLVHANFAPVQAQGD
ncbi:MAG: nuclear transport factor 2 family protein [Sphingomicrobium sp.]